MCERVYVKDFDANRAVVSLLRHLIEKTPNIEFAFAAEPSVIDRIFVQTPRGGECAVVDLDGEAILQTAHQQDALSIPDTDARQELLVKR